MKTNKTWTLLLDGDMFAFRACTSCEHEVNWGQLWTLHVDLEEAKAKFTEIVTTAIERAMERLTAHIKEDIDYSIVFAFSSKNNFRKKILSTYKQNRVGKRKPVAYSALVEWVKTLEGSISLEVDGLEADDCLGIYATKSKNFNQCVVISGDKDMKCIPSYHYDFIRDEFELISKESAYRNFLTQALIGDTTDGYSGCPKIGKVTAGKLLDKECSWQTVVEAYKKAGLSEEYALEQARMARILLADNWDSKKKEVILWKPTELD